jgi:poly(A) polymerase
LSVQIAPDVLAILTKLDYLLSERGIEAYVVGGLVRDLLSGRATADIDLAVAAEAVKTGRELAGLMGGKFVLLDESHDIARIALSAKSGQAGKEQWYIDLSGLKGGIESDLDRRDFSIDAMAIKLKTLIGNPASFEIIDRCGGQSDLKDRVIRALSEKVFESDPARILRAVRLAAELGFEILPETKAAILRDHLLVSEVAGERVREELLRILASHEAGRFMRLLDELMILTALIPELEPSRGFEQPAEHHWDVLEHSLKTVRSVDFLLRQGQWEYTSPGVLQEVPWSEDLALHFAEEVNSGSRRSSLLKLAALLHDISKPETKILAGERIRFFGHPEQGAEITAGILERLRFSHREIGLVEMMVRQHMRPTQMSHEGMPTRRAIYRFFRDTGSAGIDILFLSLADHLAARGPELDAGQWSWHTGQVKCILEGYFQQPKLIRPVKLLDGHDLINLYGLKPGPEIREILEAVRESQAAGEIFSREEALSYVKNRLLYREQK